MARRRFFIEEKTITQRTVYFIEDEEAPARENKESGRPQILGFIKRHIWPILFAIGVSAIGSVIAGFIFGGWHF